MVAYRTFAFDECFINDLADTAEFSNVFQITTKTESLSYRCDFIEDKVDIMGLIERIKSQEDMSISGVTKIGLNFRFFSKTGG